MRKSSSCSSVLCKCDSSFVQLFSPIKTCAVLVAILFVFVEQWSRVTSMSNLVARYQQYEMFPIENLRIFEVIDDICPELGQSMFNKFFC